MYDALDIALPEMFATLICSLHELFAALIVFRDFENSRVISGATN